MRLNIVTPLLVAAFSVASLMIATAADMPVKAPLKAPVAIDPGWTGIYVGGNAGYSWGRWDATGIIIGPTGQHTFSVDGFVGGLQAGFNWQFNRNWLLGVEADYQWTTEKDDFSWVFPIVIGDARSGFTIKNEMKFPWFATARARLGYIPDPSWLLYVTGGLAVGRVEDTASLTFGALSASIGDQVTKVGWTAGAGTEAKIGGASSHWSAKLEYLYIDLGTVDLFTNSVQVKVHDHIGRIGLNYRF
jgi:opacity protein-like surface antigen